MDVGVRAGLGIGGFLHDTVVADDCLLATGSGSGRLSRVLVLILAPEHATSCAPSSDRAMLIVDTGPLVAYLNRNDLDHVRCAELLESLTPAEHPA
jgi:hypothetical protein